LARAASFALRLPVDPPPPILLLIVEVSVVRCFEPVAVREALLLSNGVARNRPMGDPELAHTEAIQVRVAELVTACLIGETARAVPPSENLELVSEAIRQLQPIVLREPAKSLDGPGPALVAPTGKRRVGKGTDVVIGDALETRVQEQKQVRVVRVRVGNCRDELPDVARNVRRIERHQLANADLRFDAGLASRAQARPVGRSDAARSRLTGTALVMASARAPTGEGGRTASAERPGVGAEISGHDGVQLGSGLQAGVGVQQPMKPLAVSNQSLCLES